MIYRNYGFCIGAIIVSGWISCLTLYGKTNSSISCTVESRATFHVRFKRLYAVGLSPLARTGSVVGIFESLPLIVVPKVCYSNFWHKYLRIVYARQFDCEVACDYHGLLLIWSRRRKNVLR